MAAEFISEPLRPVGGTFDAAGMARGHPGAGLPQRFVWRGREYAVAAVLEAWKEHGPCHHGSGEMYLRKHWFKIATIHWRNRCQEPSSDRRTGFLAPVPCQDPRMTLYFERQARSRRESRARWWLFTVERAQPGKGGRAQVS